MGLAPVLVELVFKTIQDINAQGMTVLVVEQNAHMALSRTALYSLAYSSRRRWSCRAAPEPPPCFFAAFLLSRCDGSLPRRSRRGDHLSYEPEPTLTAQVLSSIDSIA